MDPRFPWPRLILIVSTAIPGGLRSFLEPQQVYLTFDAVSCGAIFAADNPEVPFPIQRPVMTAHGHRTSNLSCASRVGARVTSPNRVNNQPT